MQVIDCVAVICGVCVDYLVLPRDSKKKKKKKKAQSKEMSALENELVELLKELKLLESKQAI